MTDRTLNKVLETLADKIENLEFLVKFKDKKIADLEEENAKLKNQKKAVTEFVDRTAEKIEKRVKGG